MGHGFPQHQIKYGLDAIVRPETRISVALQTVLNPPAVDLEQDLQAQFIFSDPATARFVTITAIIDGEPVPVELEDGFYRTDLGVVKPNESITTLVTLGSELAGRDVGLTVELLEANGNNILACEDLWVAVQPA
ncbi:hypothetical protein LC087_17545 [Bacillus carboniphilus]|uniref:Uncharacterized protein n=1 Tax=Bacillus carboniphilus TaxID=86663 RepID=A0ABY9JSZ6_9BACI|nr:hypothetical protein [Bacillus carboniphilus]WLR42477.1 hypothetical protein LC087_17545 [Bacillus carboniphilus]